MTEASVLSILMYKKVETFYGDFLYLLAQYTCSLQRGTIKFNQDLDINTGIDSTHYNLTNLENRVLIEMFYISRLKLALVSTLAGMINTKQQLNKAF